jgi:hypothetical protein
MRVISLTDPLVPRTAAGALHQPRRSDLRRQKDLHSGSLSTISVLQQHGTCESEMAVQLAARCPFHRARTAAPSRTVKEHKGALFLSDRLPTERVVFETPFPTSRLADRAAEPTFTSAAPRARTAHPALLLLWRHDCPQTDDGSRCSRLGGWGFVEVSRPAPALSGLPREGVGRCDRRP